MKYRVHRLDVTSDTVRDQLEQFINNLGGEVISVLPNIKPVFRPYGATSKVDFLLVVEKTQ